MAWLDDRVMTHPKIRRVGPVAFQWWAFALCYCSAHSTGGLLDDAISVLGVPRNVVRKLVANGLWDEEQDGIWVHDWQEYNEKRDASSEQRREQARERQRRHRAKIRDFVTRDSHETERDKQRDKQRDKSRVTNSVTASRGRARTRAGARPNDQDQDQELHPSIRPSTPPTDGRTDGTHDLEPITGAAERLLANLRTREAT